MPTWGKESEFNDVLGSLYLLIDSSIEKYPGASCYIRGDFNVNTNNKQRLEVFKHFSNQLKLKAVPINEPTYHHFTGHGNSDSVIDLLLSTESSPTETLRKHLCINDNPYLFSHHDVLFSAFSMPFAKAPIDAPVLSTPQHQWFTTTDLKSNGVMMAYNNIKISYVINYNIFETTGYRMTQRPVLTFFSG